MAWGPAGAGMFWHPRESQQELSELRTEERKQKEKKSTTI